MTMHVGIICTITPRLMDVCWFWMLLFEGPKNNKSDHNNTMNQKGNHFMRKTLGKTQTIQGLEKKIKKDLELG